MKHKEYAILKGVSKDNKRSIKITIESVDTLPITKASHANFRVITAIFDALEKNYKGSYEMIKTTAPKSKRRK